VCRIRQAIIFSSCSFVLSSIFFFFSSLNLSGRTLDVYHTSTQCEFRMQVWYMRHAARCESRTQKTRQKSPSGHHRTTLSGYIFATKAHIDNRKNLLSSSMSSRYPHNMMKIGPLTAEIGWRVWDSPANFNGFRVLAALLHGTLVLKIFYKKWHTLLSNTTIAEGLQAHITGMTITLNLR